MKYLVRSIALALVLAMSFNFSVNAQTSKPKKKDVALHQYCPVAYGAMGKAAKGDATYASTYKGRSRL